MGDGLFRRHRYTFGPARRLKRQAPGRAGSYTKDLQKSAILFEFEGLLGRRIARSALPLRFLVIFEYGELIRE